MKNMFIAFAFLFSVFAASSAQAQDQASIDQDEAVAAGIEEMMAVSHPVPASCDDPWTPAPWYCPSCGPTPHIAACTTHCDSLIECRQCCGAFYFPSGGTTTYDECRRRCKIVFASTAVVNGNASNTVK